MSADRSSGSSMWLNLCLIVPISVVGYIAWKLFFPYVPSARQSEAKTRVGSMNRAQQAYYLENNSFSSSFDNLGLGVGAETENKAEVETEQYRYMIVNANSLDRPTKGDKFVTSIAIPKQQRLKSYVGIVWTGTYVDSSSGRSEPTTFAVLCEAERAGMTGAPLLTENVAQLREDKLFQLRKKQLFQRFWSDPLYSFTQLSQLYQKPESSSEPISVYAPSFSEATSASFSFSYDPSGQPVASCPQGFEALR
jgi:type IV pilus assembly protein PilA